MLRIGIKKSLNFGMPFGCLRRTPLFKGVRSVKTSTVDWKPIRGSTGNLATIEYQSRMPLLRKFFLSLMIGMPVISFILGCWQVKRMNWKSELIARCENALAAEPMDEIPANIDPKVVSEFEYRRFKVVGHFDYSQEMFLGPRIKNGVLGYLVITPFVRKNGKPILVERGWIHKDKVVPETRKEGYLSHLAFPQGEIEITALFRCMPERSGLQFDHTDGSRLFNVHDVPKMAEQAGALPIYCQMIYDLGDHIEWRTSSGKEKSSVGSLVLSYLNPWNAITWATGSSSHSSSSSVASSDALFIASHLDDETLQYQEFEFINEGVPVAALPKLTFSNNHLQYLITWFGLAFCSSIALGYSFYKKQRYSTADKLIDAKRKDMRRL